MPMDKDVLISDEYRSKLSFIPSHIRDALANVLWRAIYTHNNALKSWVDIQIDSFTAVDGRRTKDWIEATKAEALVQQASERSMVTPMMIQAVAQEEPPQKQKKGLL